MTVLEEIRNTRGLIPEALGLDTEALASIESRQRPATAEEREKLAQALGITKATLFAQSGLARVAAKRVARDSLRADLKKLGVTEHAARHRRAMANCRDTPTDHVTTMTPDAPGALETGRDQR